MSDLGSDTAAADYRIDWHYIAPGQPMQNGFYEAPEKRAAQALVSLKTAI